MEIADHLLAEGEHSITEIARAVGYRSLGRFSAAFRRQFGVTPKKHQLALGNRKLENDQRN
jgi:AraC-like DNA-binding protein